MIRNIASPFDKNEVVGEIQLIPNPQAYDQFIRENVGFVAMLLSVQLVVVVAAVLAVVLIRIIRPIKGMSDGLHTMSDSLNKMGMRGNRLLKLPRGQEDTEIGRLANDINHLTVTLEHASADFRRLLDNSGEGFLTFGSDLLIDAQYSLACETMFGRSPAGCHAAELFFHEDPAKADLFVTIISSVLNEPDADTRENILSLLPTEIKQRDVILKTEYKALDQQKFMVVLTDITAERHMATLLSRERRRLELIVMAVSDRRNFFETIDAFREFLDLGLPRMMQSGQAPQLLVRDLYREIHTYKGLLSQFSFPGTPVVLHDIESRLTSLLSLGEALTAQQFAGLAFSQILQESFDSDLAVLSDALGDEFLLYGDSFVLSDKQARQLEKLATRLLRGETVDTSVAEIRNLLHEIGTLCKVSFKDVLMGFDGLVKQAAKRLEKEVAPIEITGGADIWIDPNAFRPFLRALVHVFRNAVAHGLETLEARWEAKKDETGKITCTVEMLNSTTIRLCIADDGAGIDLQALRQRAVTSGIYAADEAAQVPDETIAQLIFRDNISTQQEVSDLAGRGIGLAAVLNETKNIGGEVVVKTMVGQGTRFLFVLPLQPIISS